MKNVNEIRTSFLNYFQKHQHEIVPSSSLIPANDPTLMFTNAGMVQFKNLFTGAEKAPYNRAATAQKCVRAGGKHNDLDNVGYTARHHTFFEMLGNFSFGDYFKEEAISLAWNFLTKELALPAEKLLVTVFHEDEESAILWKKIAGLSKDKIIPIATCDNFWSMGDTGPCGPCSEIFYDHGPEIWGGPPGSADEKGDRFIEIWNLVFMQFEALSNAERIALPRPSIDTGMGLERIAAVLQGVHDNYDIDLFKRLIHNSQELSGVKAEGNFAVSHRVIADHLRSSSFLIADGVLPSNEGRGYVLRRIMRRAMRHVNLLGVEEPFLYRLLPVLIEEMGEAYPELKRAQSLIGETLKLEEIRFQKTLTRGMHLLNVATQSLKGGERLAGDVAFKLYDTYGFPLDLTQDALRTRNIEVDIAGFDEAMAKQKAEARANWVGSGENALEQDWFDLREELGATEFLGYDCERSEAIITALRVKGQAVNHISDQEEDAIIVTNQTPFYAESGGQIGDKGFIIKDDARFEVYDTLKKAGKIYAHLGRMVRGNLAVNDKVLLEVDGGKRAKIRANHSATHILHEALREILGPHIAQKGSFVSAERLRFDFSHNYAISSEELAKIECLANKIILQNSPVAISAMALDEAIALGARALFGEKYEDEVRVVSMGANPVRPQIASNDKAYWSIELCGGLHVERTGDIGLLHIIAEGAIASGVRRIEALTGEAARNYLTHKEHQIKNLAQLLKAPEETIYERVEALYEERKLLAKTLNDLKKQQILKNTISDVKNIEHIHDIAFIGHISRAIQAQDLRALVDSAKKQIKSGVIAFIGLDEEEKASIAVGVTADLTEKYSAVELMRAALNYLGGKGGGRADMAQGGGPRGTEAQKAIEAIRKML